MNTSSRERIVRALLAAQAVTLGTGLIAVGCGTTEVRRPDAGDAGTDTTDGGGDTAVDVVVDANVCFIEMDDVCPADCTPDNDGDCCEDSCGGPGWSYLDPTNGCSCAVEGPFAPPSLAA